MNNFKKMIFSIITLGLAIGVVVTFIFKDHQILQHNSDVEIQPEAIEEEHLANQKVMYLTFDDGPSEYTKKIVDILDEHQVPATFFFIGKNTDKMVN